MGRTINRVPLDFDWPLDQVWQGYLMPDTYSEIPCPENCQGGYSPRARAIYDFWYGKIPYDPVIDGSEPLHRETPGVRALAVCHTEQSPEFYGTGEAAVAREAQRLAILFNSQFSHHLKQQDVDALVAAGRLMDFTHTWTREDGWQQKDPPFTPTAEQVNAWSLQGMGHDSINAHVVIKARCATAGVSYQCGTCGGHGSLEAYDGQRAEAEKWTPTKPPEGDGWQLWETVSEGSPISPVFPTADDLAAWMSDPERGDRWVPQEAARKFIEAGWAPTGAITAKTGVIPGVEMVGWESDNS